MHDIAVALNQIGEELKASYFERDDMIEAMQLGILCGEHVFVHGDPGSGKSEATRAFVTALGGPSYFEVALSKHTPPEVVLGPLNIKEFRDNGSYHRKRTGFATDVEIAFFDEIGKASPVLGHDLLALLNERIYHEVNGARSSHAAPLWMALAAANEIPTAESDDNAAMYDRLLIRCSVDYIKSKVAFAKLLTADVAPPTTRVNFDDVKKVAEVEVAAMPLPKDTVRAIVALRLTLEKDHNIVVSDRRWRQSVKVLKARAFLSGHTQVGEDDLSALRFTLWSSLDQIKTVTDAVEGAANPFAEGLQGARKLLKEIGQGIAERATNPDEFVRASFGKEANTKLGAVRKLLDEVIDVADGRTVPGLAEVADQHKAMLIRCYVDLLGIDLAQAEVLTLKYMGKGGGSQVVAQ